MTLHDTAQAQAELGMQRSLERAEDEIPGWGKIARAFLKGYAQRHEFFAGWMVVRAAAALASFPAPPNAKAWGKVIQRASREGLIAKHGWTTDPHRHNNPIPLWRSNVFDGGAATQ